MRKTLLLALLSGTTLFGQGIIQSEGDVPVDFTQAYRSALIDKYEGKNVFNSNAMEREGDRFFKKAEFVLHELLINGDVLFGDPITNYLNDLADGFIKGNPSIQEKLVVYTLRSHVPNAFMMTDGHLFVTTGLLAQVQNEAELALIMAHEIGHMENDDLRRGFENRYENENDYGGGDLKSATDLLSELNYSKELELEADDFGLNMLINSGMYDPAEAINVFDVLLFAYLPFDEVAIDPHWLLADGLELPADYLLPEVNAITAFDDYDDSKSTHPNIKKRKEQFIEALLEADIPEGVGAYSLGEERFLEVQSLARVNVLRQDLQARNYVRAVYNGYLMTRNDSVPNEDILSTVGYALHALAGYKIEKDYDEVAIDAEDAEGEIHTLYFFFENATDRELTALALAYNFDLHQKFPENAFIEEVYQQSLENLVRYFEMDVEEVTHPIEVANVEVADTLSEEEFNALSKLEKIRYRRAVDGEERTWLGSVLGNYAENEQLKADFEAMWDEYNEDKEGREGLSERDWREVLAERRSRGHDRALNIDHAIYFSPVLYYLDREEDDILDIAQTYVDRARLNEFTKEVISITGFNAEYLSPDDFHTDDVQLYNDYATLRAWIAERMDHVNTPVGNSLHTEVLDIAERYGTPYVIFPLVISEKESRKNAAATLVYTLVYPPLWPAAPFAIYNALVPTVNQYYTTWVFNIETNAVLMIDIERYKARMKPDYAHQIIYDALFQITNDDE